MPRVVARTIGVLTMLLLVPGLMHAELIDRGGGFIYDDVLDVTWTQNANINGLDTWAGQVAWAESLSLFDPIRGVTWDDWRLPSVDVDADDTIVDCASATEVACRDNEYGYLFHQYEIRESAPGPFIDVQSSDYWSGTEFRPNPLGAWVFRFFGGGTQAGGDKIDDNYAWAIRDGDVAFDDSDGDGVEDNLDNCIEVANPSQCDSDGDGFGNHCDGDLDNSGGIVNFADLGLFGDAFGEPSIPTAYNAADFDCSAGVVGFTDLNLFKSLFGNPAGP